jgi:hypothetical protein
MVSLFQATTALVEASSRSPGEWKMQKFSDHAIDRAKEDAAEWLNGNSDGYPRSWEQEARDEARRGYAFYGPNDAPPIAGYEALEREGAVVRMETLDCRGQERIHFRVVPSNDDGTQPARTQVVA